MSSPSDGLPPESGHPFGNLCLPGGFREAAGPGKAVRLIVLLAVPGINQGIPTPVFHQNLLWVLEGP